jgi:REP element-mobilizing transposase RayT
METNRFIVEHAFEGFYRRRLPHWQPAGGVFFITYRLFGSLPAEALARIADERRLLLMEPRRDDEPPRGRALRTSARLFRLAEELLEQAPRARHEPFALETPEVTEMVCAELLRGDGVDYRLHRFVVMPNHVHLLLQPLKPLEVERLRVTLQRLKGRTSRRANRILGRSGTFWQDESYDHSVRDLAEYAHLIEYIDFNPVNAGLCATPELWTWGSAGKGVELLPADTLPWHPE